MERSIEYQKGIELARQLFGNERGEFEKLPLPEGDDLYEELVTWLYGYMMQERPLLDTRIRLLSAISMLTCLERKDMLADWTRSALRFGCTEKEIREVIIMMSIYAGWPVTRTGLEVASKVFEEQGA